MKKVVLIYSGGLDSTVLLYHLRSIGYEVLPMGVNYGQRHSKELERAKAICKGLGLEYHVADLSNIAHWALSGSSQTDPNVDVPDGHYAEESMKVTVVPNRNMIMLSIAAAYAIAQKAEFIAYGAHAGDHAIYPDCRPEFTEALEKAISLADWHQVSFLRPFIGITKADIVTEGVRLDVPFDKTWSCYKGRTFQCGVCGTCVERREAFQLARVKDPTHYANG